MEVSVVDYGVGNLLNVRRAFEHFGADVRIVDDAASIRDSEILVLPGVGAFADGMSGLHERGLVEPLREYADASRYLLGICLGMQLLAAEGEEFGLTSGLGIIEGRVQKIEPLWQQEQIRIPQISWHWIGPADRKTGTLSDPIFYGLPDHPEVYFVHSFFFRPDQQETIIAVYELGGADITAAIRRKNVWGTQFHPEKSGPLGLKIIENFLKLATGKNP